MKKRGGGGGGGPGVVSCLGLVALLGDDGANRVPLGDPGLVEWAIDSVCSHWDGAL